MALRPLNQIKRTREYSSFILRKDCPIRRLAKLKPAEVLDRSPMIVTIIQLCQRPMLTTILITNLKRSYRDSRTLFNYRTTSNIQIHCKIAAIMNSNLSGTKKELAFSAIVNLNRSRDCTSVDLTINEILESNSRNRFQQQDNTLIQKRKRNVLGNWFHRFFWKSLNHNCL